MTYLNFFSGLHNFTYLYQAVSSFCFFQHKDGYVFEEVKLIVNLVTKVDMAVLKLSEIQIST